MCVIVVMFIIDVVPFIVVLAIIMMSIAVVALFTFTPFSNSKPVFHVFFICFFLPLSLFLV